MRKAFLTPSLAILVAGAGTPAAAQATDAVPLPTLGYHGYLAENNQPVTGTRSLIFQVWDKTGHKRWDSSAQPVTVTGGYYDVVLGGAGMLPFPAGLVEAAEKHGAIMMVDDAHSSGVLGRNGRGTIDHFGLHGRVQRK